MRAGRKHLRKLQLEKQRFEFMKSIINEYQMIFAKFAIEQPAKNKTKLVIGVIAITGAILFGYWNIIVDLIRGVF